MERRDSGLLVGALGLALSFSPSLMRRTKRDQVLVSATALAFGAIAGTWTEALVAQLARRMGDREGAARGVVIGAGAVAIVGQLPASRHSPVAFVGSVARVAGISAIVGTVAPERTTGDPLRDPRKRFALWAAGVGSYLVYKEILKRSTSRRAASWPGPRRTCRWTRSACSSACTRRPRWRSGPSWRCASWRGWAPSSAAGSWSSPPRCAAT
jgi:hypothetical protein